MSFERPRRKLYFDVTWPGGTRSAMYFPCTPFRSSASFGDRFGGLLAAAEALTGSSPHQSLALNEVTAVFVPNHGPFAGTQFTAQGLPVAVDFVGPTFGTQVVAGAPGGGVPNNANVTRLPYLTPTGKDLTKMGMSAVFGTLGTSRHFSVRLRRPNAGAGSAAANASLYGTLYVSRQHSLEV